jgi:cytochrome c-type biogenesis protein CcmH/NrfG
MLVCELFGMNAGAHHLVNVGLHCSNALLVFAVFLALTGAVWPSGFVAALFALHPLHVESVAWVAERKDVLSAIFWLLTMGAYVLYTRRPGWLRYLAVVGCFALGLMAKPMLVTLPFVLLLLDIWPLRRLPLQSSSVPVLARLVAEKVPLLALAAIASVVAFQVQRNWGAMPTEAQLPWTVRGGNALVSYVRYLGMMVWPVNLAVFYPHPGALPLRVVVSAGLMLAGVTVWVMRAARVRPSLAVGWLWYVGTLLPVIGLVQVGLQARADRYTYLPLLGLFVMAAWGLADWLGRWRWGRVALAGGAVAVISACAAATGQQVAVWRNSVTLFEHALAAGWESPLAHYNLAHALAKQGRTAEAITQYREALRLKPDEPKTHDNLGLLLADQGRTAEAIAEIREALRLKPDRPGPLNNLAWILAANPEAELRDGAGAVRLAERACKLTAYQEAGLLDTLAVAYAEAGRFPEALATAEKAVGIATRNGEESLAEEIRSRLPLYRAGRPYREPLRQATPAAAGR